MEEREEVKYFYVQFKHLFSATLAHSQVWENTNVSVLLPRHFQSCVIHKEEMTSLTDLQLYVHVVRVPGPPDNSQPSHLTFSCWRWCDGFQTLPESSSSFLFSQHDSRRRTSAEYDQLLMAGLCRPPGRWRRRRQKWVNGVAVNTVVLADTQTQYERVNQHSESRELY